MTKEKLKSDINTINNKSSLCTIKGFIMGMLAQKESGQTKQFDEIKESNIDLHLLELVNNIDEDTKWLIVQSLKMENRDINYQDDYAEFMENKNLEEIFIIFSTLTDQLTLTIINLLAFMIKINQVVNKEH